jgi:DnaB-like helicase N terminal domain/AAA domain
MTTSVRLNGSRNGQRVPPHDIDAEEAVLGAVLVSPHAADTAFKVLHPEDFFVPAHQTIFAAAMRARIEGPVDAVTLAAALGGELAEVGGAARLVELQGSLTAISAVGRYADIVAHAATARRVISTAARVADEAYDGMTDPLGLAREAFSSMSPAGRASPPADLTTVEAFLNRADVERPQFVIPGVVREGHRVIVVAPEGQGKMVLLAQIALCAAHGIHPFLPDEIIPKVPVLIVPLENPLDAIEEHLLLSIQPLVRRNRHDPEHMALWHREAGLDLRSRRGRADLEAVIAETRPKLIVYGPLYRSGVTKGKEQYETGASEVQTVINELTERYRCAWLFEAHAPSGESGKAREMRPFGSVQWRYWPDAGFGLQPDGEKDHRGSYHRFKVVPFRGARTSAITWPSELSRGRLPGDMPWMAKYPTGTLNRPGPSDEPF